MAQVPHREGTDSMFVSKTVARLTLRILNGWQPCQLVEKPGRRTTQNNILRA